MKLGKHKDFFILKDYHEITDYEVEYKVLSCFLEEGELLLFNGGVITSYNNCNQFIRDRLVFEDDEWIDFFPPDEDCDLESKTSWYFATNKDEVIQALRYNGLFSCVVVMKGRELSERSFELFHLEEDYGSSLYIREKIPGLFTNMVLPRIKEIMPVE
ncbi:hypothetical protein GPJ61_10705 [Brevibacillus formosus]|uniref:hypothetical protein n=1 Tax=Brevibacillus formosus TaxID=54913 RepID=UPI001CA4C57D|nr:hypothetical protein [Brevibacillus formosus]MBW5468326.1 hypothetical protein [Brevibacillus formosus]